MNFIQDVGLVFSAKLLWGVVCIAAYLTSGNTWDSIA